ncbi:hypothetical protein DCAR_0208695 [Daucus carota subsp. sativus]|uniref:Uncharacterized protein n=1 Tax=Daucus carota subsp. sativus TaxID=79200 RepID=A0AAF0WH53_DAUCS|nr:PREDICTED: uncharacterized protein LOC108206279 [Daucus carota subsp. sativus]WOG89457.1 hypothetical protein DCAR_0208695 [Daucus carota subsp. sativus]
MHSRILPMEESKDGFVTIRPNQPKVLPHRMLQFLVLFLVMCVTFSVVSVYLIRHFGAQNIVAATGFKTNIFQCVEGANTSLDRWIKPPSNLLHTMSDKELFWLASLVPRRKEYPFTRVPKIAFMFLTKGPLPLAPLWERFFRGHDERYSIYIHSLPSFVPNFPSSSVFYKRQIPSEVAEWGTMSICDAERRLLANALLDVSNEYFVLLSESCIPLYNFSVVYDYIKNSKYSFIGAFDDPGPYGRGRYNYRMAPEIEITHWRKGSQWFEINRKLAIHIVEDTTFYPKFNDFCKPACYVDEHYFPTMLTIRAPNLLANRSVTWVDWSRGGAHPATFGRGDISEDFLKNIFVGGECLYNDRNSSVCSLFARKFAPSSLKPLLLLAPQILGF